MTQTPIGILVSSDRAAAGIYEDKGGPAIETYLAEVLTTPWRGVKLIVPDEQAVLERALIRLADDEGCPLILTTGGTGIPGTAATIASAWKMSRHTSPTVWRPPLRRTV